MAKVKHVAVGEQLDSVEWADGDTHEVVSGTAGILLVSNPPSGKYKVVNVYVEHLGGSSYKFVYEWSDTPEP